jgi:hypothetical protein
MKPRPPAVPAGRRPGPPEADWGTAPSFQWTFPVKDLKDKNVESDQKVIPICYSRQRRLEFFVVYDFGIQVQTIKPQGSSCLNPVPWRAFVPAISIMAGF